MNWEAIGSIAQLLGAVGVIASLLYLAVQIRQNTRATRLATSRSTASAVREWNQPMLNDADLAWTFQVGAEDPSRLDAKERARFYYLCSSFFRMFEDLHYQYVKGALDDEVWEGYVRHYGAYAKAPGMQGYWAARRHVYHPGFRDFLETYVPPAFDRLDAIVERGAGKGEAPEQGWCAAEREDRESTDAGPAPSRHVRAPGPAGCERVRWRVVVEAGTHAPWVREH